MSTTPTATPPDDKPQSLFDKVSTALPIGLTALATVFAGMSTSELQKAMFWRTAAGQDQAKATNQWTFAGLKRNRSLIMEGTAAQLGAQPGKREGLFTAPEGAKAEEKVAAEWLAGKGPPRVSLPKIDDPNIQAARFAMEQRRYRAESSLSLGVGFLYDARVRVVTAVSDHHRQRSENFFYAMLAAQIGAVISTLSLARQQKSALLFLAALVGAAAVAFGAFVYLAI